MKIKNPTLETLKRIDIAKEYFDMVKEKMGEWFITAYVFGSTSRNEAKEHSDIDIIFVLKRPDKEARIRINSTEGGLWTRERQGLICSTYYEEYITIYRRALQEKYAVDLSPYYFYHENDGSGTYWLKGNLLTPYEELIKISLHYPDDLIA